MLRELIQVSLLYVKALETQSTNPNHHPFFFHLQTPFMPSGSLTPVPEANLFNIPNYKQNYGTANGSYETMVATYTQMFPVIEICGHR